MNDKHHYHGFAQTKPNIFVKKLLYFYNGPSRTPVPTTKNANKYNFANSSINTNFIIAIRVYKLIDFSNDERGGYNALAARDSIGHPAGHEVSFWSKSPRDSIVTATPSLQNDSVATR